MALSRSIRGRVGIMIGPSCAVSADRRNVRDVAVECLTARSDARCGGRVENGERIDRGDECSVEYRWGYSDVSLNTSGPFVASRSSSAIDLWTVETVAMLLRPSRAAADASPRPLTAHGTYLFVSDR